MRVKPLKTLLEQADQFCQGTALSKTASAHESDGVSALADLLAGADTDIILVQDSNKLNQEEMDKIAESLNRIQTAAEIDVMLKLNEFEKKAQAQGFSQDQIDEAFSKIAAQKLAVSLPALVAMGLAPLSKPEADKNSLPKKPSPKPSQAQLLGGLSLTDVGC